MKLLSLIITILAFNLPQNVKADPVVYNLNLIQTHIYLGTFGGEELYCAIVPRFNENDDTGIVLVRNDTSRMDLEFFIETDGDGFQTLFHFVDNGGARINQVPSVIQYMYTGFCSPGASNIKVKGRNIEVVYNPVCSRYNAPIEQTDLWGWRDGKFEKVGTKERNPYKESLDLYRKRLKSGKIYEAVKEAPEADPTGGWGPPTELFADLFDAVYIKAMKDYKAGKDLEAVTLVRWALNQSFVNSVENEEDKFVLRWDPKSKNSDNLIPGLTLKKTPENAEMLLDLSEILEDLYYGQARMFKDQVANFLDR